MLDELDKKIISLVQGDIPVCEQPFEPLAQELNISPEHLLDKIKELKQQGVIRRFGATLRHQEAGFNANAMVAWLAPEEQIEEAGAIMAGFREVTHCYQRVSQADWPYNLYTMVHAGDQEECGRIAQNISKATGLKEYLLLFSEKEFKKTSMAYFKGRKRCEKNP